MRESTLSLKTCGLGLASAITLAFSSSAQADLINGIVDQWNVSVDTVFNTTSICDSNGDCTQPNGITVVNNRSLRWGDSGQSGLDITGSPSSATVVTDGAAVANVSITHLNNPITGTTLSSLNILSTLTLTPLVPLGVGKVGPTTITFGVNFLETPNGANPCANGGTNWTGVNINGCADIYVTDQNSLNFLFMYDLDGAATEYDAMPYYISFFELSQGLNPLPVEACSAVGVSSPCLGFMTPEAQNTTVQFASLITSVPVVIPEPGILALFGISLAGVGIVRRRKM
jgi:hypothetical protein